MDMLRSIGKQSGESVESVLKMECQSIFNFTLPSVIIPDGCETFRVKYESCNNSLYKLALSPL